MGALFKIEYKIGEKDCLSKREFIRWYVQIFRFIKNKHIFKETIKKIWVNKTNRKIFTRSLGVLILLAICSACLLGLIWDSLWDYWILTLAVSIVYITVIMLEMIVRNISREKKGQKVHVLFYKTCYVVQSETGEEKYSLNTCLETKGKFILPGICVISKGQIEQDVEKKMSSLIKTGEIK